MDLEEELLFGETGNMLQSMFDCIYAQNRIPNEKRSTRKLKFVKVKKSVLKQNLHTAEAELVQNISGSTDEGLSVSKDSDCNATPEHEQLISNKEDNEDLSNMTRSKESSNDTDFCSVEKCKLLSCNDEEENRTARNKRYSRKRKLRKSSEHTPNNVQNPCDENHGKEFHRPQDFLTEERSIDSEQLPRRKRGRKKKSQSMYQNKSEKDNRTIPCRISCDSDQHQRELSRKNTSHLDREINKISENKTNLSNKDNRDLKIVSKNSVKLQKYKHGDLENQRTQQTSKRNDKKVTDLENQTSDNSFTETDRENMIPVSQLTFVNSEQRPHRTARDTVSDSTEIYVHSSMGDASLQSLFGARKHAGAIWKSIVTE